MSLYQQLVERGFTLIAVTGEGDFELRDDSDGRGVYISNWQSAEECPFPDFLREPEGKEVKRTFRSQHPAKSHLRADWRQRRLPGELDKHDRVPVASQAETPQPEAPAATEITPVLTRNLSLNGKVYSLVPMDALALFGALAQAVDGETARITLASGDVLELTHQDVSDIGRQLAGKPADEVSG